MSELARLIPSPRSLLIFEAAARSGSCSAAAREFNLTQPSASRNIAQLEARLGVPLFTRHPTGLELTAEGRVLHRALADGFDRIAAAIHEIAAQGTRKQVVELSLSTAFVTHWFIPRLGDFHAAFPGVDVRFQLISGTLRGAIGTVDLAMRMGSEADDEHHSWPFAPELVVPVCSPAYLARNGPLERPMRAAGHVLLHLSDPLLDWALLWGGVHGRDGSPHTWIAFSDYAVVIQAAMNGEGIALGWTTTVARALQEGKLVAASGRVVRTGKTYHLLAPRTKPLRPVVLAIRDWLIGEMAGDVARLGPLLGESGCPAPSAPF
ncbi:MAG: LysR family transcriptional regulator [Alphaproteobacteria bacterium]|nr:LysR family transcriptional regulator [Alphaproteobacteria bacterium]